MQNPIFYDNTCDSGVLVLDLPLERTHSGVPVLHPWTGQLFFRDPTGHTLQGNTNRRNQGVLETRDGRIVKPYHLKGTRSLSLSRRILMKNRVPWTGTVILPILWVESSTRTPNSLYYPCTVGERDSDRVS